MTFEEFWESHQSGPAYDITKAAWESGNKAGYESAIDDVVDLMGKCQCDADIIRNELG